MTGGLSDIYNHPYNDNHFIMWNCLFEQTVLLIRKVDSKMDAKGIRRRIINSIIKKGLSGRIDKPFLIYDFSSMENPIAVMYRYMGLIRK